MTHFFGTNITIYKMVVIGDPRVGKTSIRRRYLGASFDKSYILTIGADFAVKTYDNKAIQIWDLAGHPIYKNVRLDFYRGAEGVIIVFDITNINSLNNIINWSEEVLKVTGKPIPIVLVGNKSDLKDGDFEIVTQDEINEQCNSLVNRVKREIQYIETSALTGNNIDIVFQNLLNEIDVMKLK